MLIRWTASPGDAAHGTASAHCRCGGTNPWRCGLTDTPAITSLLFELVAARGARASLGLDCSWRNPCSLSPHDSDSGMIETLTPCSFIGQFTEPVLDL